MVKPALIHITSAPQGQEGKGVEDVGGFRVHALCLCSGRPCQEYAERRDGRY